MSNPQRSSDSSGAESNTFDPKTFDVGRDNIGGQSNVLDQRDELKGGTSDRPDSPTLGYSDPYRNPGRGEDGRRAAVDDYDRPIGDSNITVRPPPDFDDQTGGDTPRYSDSQFGTTAHKTGIDGSDLQGDSGLGKDPLDKDVSNVGSNVRFDQSVEGSSDDVFKPQTTTRTVAGPDYDTKKSSGNDSIMGKMMETAGGALKSEKLEEKGREKREASGYGQDDSTGSSF